MGAIDNNLQTKRARFRLLRERFHCCSLSESTSAVACSLRERESVTLFGTGNAVAESERALTVLPVCGRA